jgi:hypothetical protein
LLNAAGKNLQGATVGDRIATTAHYSPCVGFNYDLKWRQSYSEEV